MTRHGKNCTAGAAYTYHERKRDAKASGYGTLHARLGADSIKEFDCCSLTLQPCKDPVITMNGVIFDRQSVLEYILAQKKDISKRTKEWEKQCVSEKDDTKKAADAETDRRLKKFAALEGTPSHPGAKVDLKDFESPLRSNPLKRSHPGSTTIGQPAEKVKAIGNEGEMSNMKGERSKELPSFWIPELRPNADAAKLEKPNQKVLCPITGKSLKLKDLMDVKFTCMPQDSNSKDSDVKTNRYMCPVTHDGLGNTTRCAYLKTSKSVVVWNVIEKLIRKDWMDPVSGQAMKESDIIELQRGGTGYAATNEVKAKMMRPQLELQ